MIKKTQKNIFLNVGIVIISIIFAVFLIELILLYFGPYKQLASNKLKPSISVYERPSNSYQKQKHPDLNYISEHYFDSDGVKNDNPRSIIASKHKNIIGFFGDSMIENIFVDPKFNFVNMLNNKIKSNHIAINFGIGGYSLDQIFLRYLKYSNLEFKYVFCYINPGDHVTRNIINFDDTGNFEIVPPKFNLFQKIIGKMNISYFLIDIFYKLRAELYENHTEIDKKNYNKVLASRFYRQDYNLSKKNHYEFIKILKVFKSEVEKNNAKFIVLLYPDPNLINFFKKELIKNKINIEYFVLDKDLMINDKLRFKNDGHWNEYGNLILSKNLIKLLSKNFVRFIDNDFSNIETEILEFYKVNK